MNNFPVFKKEFEIYTAYTDKTPVVASNKSNLVRVTSEEIQKHRCKAYKYII